MRHCTFLDWWRDHIQIKMSQHFLFAVLYASTTCHTMLSSVHSTAFGVILQLKYFFFLAILHSSKVNQLNPSMPLLHIRYSISWDEWKRRDQKNWWQVRGRKWKMWDTRRVLYMSYCRADVPSYFLSDCVRQSTPCLSEWIVLQASCMQTVLALYLSKSILCVTRHYIHTYLLRRYHCRFLHQTN